MMESTVYITPLPNPNYSLDDLEATSKAIQRELDELDALDQKYLDAIVEGFASDEAREVFRIAIQNGTFVLPMLAGKPTDRILFFDNKKFHDYLTVIGAPLPRMVGLVFDSAEIARGVYGTLRHIYLRRAMG